MIDVLYHENNTYLIELQDTSDKEKYLKHAQDVVENQFNFNMAMSREEFDNVNQQNWFIPEEYKYMDILGYLSERCDTDEEKERVWEEFKEFEQRDLIMIIKVAKYLVDTMKEHNIVWGVGRGSSVASFCLYLIGINKINPLKYGLDFKEFIK